MSAAILSRVFVAGYAVKQDPLYSLLVLTSLTLVSVLLFLVVTIVPSRVVRPVRNG